jgi:hypothetical protein
MVSASVVELDSEISVSGAVADQLSLSVGEPTPSSTGAGSAFELDAHDTAPLSEDTGTPPAWTGSVDLTFVNAACVVVDDGAAGATATLACTPQVAGKAMLDLAGVHISVARLKQIEDAVTASEPLFDIANGLVVGMVLDSSGNPVTGAVVSAGSGATVSYIAADGMSLDTTGTSRGGIFVSTDAPFATTWTSQVAGTQTSGFGGLVQNKVTVVVLQAPTHT